MEVIVFSLLAKKEFSIREFAKMISEALDYNDKKIFYDKKKYVGSRNKKLSTRL